MSLQKTVGEIMVPITEFSHVSPSHTLREVMAALAQSGRAGGPQSATRIVLIFDQDYQLAGAVRRLDLLRGLEPRFLVEDRVEDQRSIFPIGTDEELALVEDETLEENLRRRAERPISEVMSPIYATLQHDDLITKAVAEIIHAHVQLLPVVKEDTVVGVVTVDELFHDVTHLLLEEG